MKLTEMLVSIAIFLIASALFTSSLISLRKRILESEGISRNAVSLLETDSFLRKEIQSFNVPYWKNFNCEFEGIRKKLLLSCNQKEIKVISVSLIYDRKHMAEGIKIEWTFSGKNYSTQEFIKQKVVYEDF